MNMDRYLRAVRRRLNKPKELKDRVMADFLCSLDARMEDGQKENEILAELGTPKQAAQELNRQMQEYTYRKSPWRWGALGLAIFSGLCLAYKGLPSLQLALFNTANHASIGIIGGADGPTEVFVTTAETGRIIPSAGIYVLLLTMGLFGFLALGKLMRE